MRGRLGLCLVVFLLAIGISTILINAQYSDPAAPTRMRYRPLIGGIQIEIFWQYIGPSWCTIGYTGKDSNGRMGVITAGHCTDHSIVYQPDDLLPGYNYIGTPSAINSYVDAAFIPFSNSAPYILHIMCYGGTCYASQWNVYKYVRWEDSIYYSSTVYKTGRTTGTTSGYIVGIGGDYLIYTTVPIDYGDSGAPLYTISPGVVLFGHLTRFGYPYSASAFTSVTGVINYLNVYPATYP
jgi:hypothetical protein